MKIGKISDTKVTLTEEVITEEKVTEHTLNSLKELLGKHVVARDSWIRQRDEAIANLTIQEAEVAKIECYIAEAKGMGIVEEHKEIEKETGVDT